MYYQNCFPLPFVNFLPTVLPNDNGNFLLVPDFTALEAELEGYDEEIRKHLWMVVLQFHTLVWLSDSALVLGWRVAAAATVVMDGLTNPVITIMTATAILISPDANVGDKIFSGIACLMAARLLTSGNKNTVKKSEMLNKYEPT